MDVQPVIDASPTTRQAQQTDNAPQHSQPLPPRPRRYLPHYYIPWVKDTVRKTKNKRASDWQPMSSATPE